MNYEAFAEQLEFHHSQARIRGLFAGKRGGKTEPSAVEMIVHLENKIGYKHSEIDPYMGVIIAPTTDMLDRICIPKFIAYGSAFAFKFNQNKRTFTWHNGSVVHGISGEKPKRLEGIKANAIWIDEVFQHKEQMFLEAVARVSDTKGRLWVSGSLGTQYTNPKRHWVYKHFYEKPIKDSAAFEWPTAANPHFPKDELDRLADTLDPRTFRQLFEIDWNIPGSAVVYEDFDESNLIRGYQYDPQLETAISIDWGWTHKCAVGFFQYNQKTDEVFLFDEIVMSKLLLSDLWDRIKAKGYKINHWYCDIAGKRTDEKVGYSNIRWFRDAPRNIEFKYRSTAINYGIPIVRTYIKNGLGQRKFKIDEIKCPHSIDGIRNYSYQEKDGVILNELPVKKDDDAVDMIRYYFVNRLDKNFNKGEFEMLGRFGDKAWQSLAMVR